MATLLQYIILRHQDSTFSFSCSQWKSIDTYASLHSLPLLPLLPMRMERREEKKRQVFFLSLLPSFFCRSSNHSSQSCPPPSAFPVMGQYVTHTHTLLLHKPKWPEKRREHICKGPNFVATKNLGRRRVAFHIKLTPYFYEGVMKANSVDLSNLPSSFSSEKEAQRKSPPKLAPGLFFFPRAQPPTVVCKVEAQLE